MSLEKLDGGTLIFVPGIMGSELRLIGMDSSGVMRDEVVWGEKFSAIWKTLARNPGLLASTDLVATKVIREVKLSFGIRPEPVYGPLIDFCCSARGLGLTLDQSFRAFAYDWRRDLRATAVELDDFVKEVPEPVFIVAHSMGGLVTRLMLKNNGSGAVRVKGVLQIASPVAGSSKAFITLKRHPSLGLIADALWKTFHMLDPAKRGQLMAALASMDSLYQLLPPDSSKILLKRGGIQFSAVDLSGWQKKDHQFILAASNVHKQLAVAPSVEIKCIYGVTQDTDWLVAIDDHWNILATRAQASGDGTVTSASASAASVNWVALNTGDCEHTQLCSRPDVHEELRRFLS